MKTFVGFNQGQYGDLFIGLTAARVLKRIEPDSRILLSINEKYKDVAPILVSSPDIEDVVIWDQYDGWPSSRDKAHYEKLKSKYGVIHLFNPMPQHSVPDWYKFWHQTEEFCVMHGLPRPTEDEMNFTLPSPNTPKEDYMCIAAHTSFGDRKNLSKHIINAAKDVCEEKGWDLVQLGGPDDSSIDGATKFDGSYAESIRKMFNGSMLVTADTGMAWAASAYGQKTCAFYSKEFYPDAKVHWRNWVPKNPNQISFAKDYISQFSRVEAKQGILDHAEL